MVTGTAASGRAAALTRTDRPVRQHGGRAVWFRRTGTARVTWFVGGDRQLSTVQ